MTIKTRINYIRRVLFKKYRLEQYNKTINERLGRCKTCGKCCFYCEHLSKTNKCLIYDKRPKWCLKDFPIDEKEIKAYRLKGKCGYYWKEKKNDKQ